MTERMHQVKEFFLKKNALGIGTLEFRRPQEYWQAENEIEMNGVQRGLCP